MKFRAANRQHMVAFDLTPMVDVVFLLIIFFMTTAQFVQRARVNLELPREKGESLPELNVPPLVVNVVAQGSTPYIVGDTAYSLNGVLGLVDDEIRRLAGRGAGAGELELTLRADRRSATAPINHLAEALRDRGVTRWRIAVHETR